MIKTRHSHLAKAIALVLAGVTYQAVAVEDYADEAVSIERISIIGSSSNDTIKSTGSAYVLSEEELNKFERTNIHGILRAVPGVYLREEDGNGFYPRIGIRASSSGRSDRISIMEDGVPAAMAPYGNTSAYFFPNAARMRAVEVLKGPEVLLYGPQTTSGAINLLSTAIPDEHSGNLNAEIGDHSSRKLHAHYGGTQGQWGYLLETYQRATDGHQSIDRTSRPAGIDTEEYIGKLRWTSHQDARFQQQVDVKYQYTQEYANVSYLGLTEDDFHADPERRYGLSELERMDRGRKGFSIQYQLALTDNTVLNTTYYDYETKRIYDRLNQINGIGIGANGITSQINNNAPDAELLQGILDGTADTTHPNGVRYGHNHQAFDSRGLQVELQHYFDTGSVSHELTVAARRHEDTTHNAVNGISNSIYHQVNGSLVFEETISGPRQRGAADATAIWIADRISVGEWTIIPIVRFEDIDTKANLVLNPTEEQIAARNTNSISKTTAGLGVNYAVNPNWTVLAGIHQGFAPPGVGVAQGSKGEESTNFEAGVRYREGGLGIDAIAFFSDYNNALRNCLVANPCAGGIVDGTEQAGQKEVYGLELGLFADVYQGDTFRVPVRFAYTYTDGEYTRDSDLDGGVQRGDVLDYTPKHTASAQIGLEGHNGWRSYLAASYTDGSCSTTTCERTDATFLRTDSLFTVDWSATIALNSSAELYVKVENLFDQQKITHRGADGARGNQGRTAGIGLRLSF